MAAPLTVDEEHGSYTRCLRHPHNGYWAGDFDRHPVGRPVPPPQFGAWPAS